MYILECRFFICLLQRRFRANNGFGASIPNAFFARPNPLTMKVLKALPCLLAMLFALAAPPRAEANNAPGRWCWSIPKAPTTWISLHFIAPYLGNFGVPYTVLDISSTPVDSSPTNFALIIIGHSQLDTNGTYLDAAALKQSFAGGIQWRRVGQF